MTAERFGQILTWAPAGLVYVGPRRYTCERCGASYPHDQAYRHAVSACPYRTSRKGD